MKWIPLAMLAISMGAQADYLTQVDRFASSTEGWGGGANTTHISTAPGQGYLQLSRPLNDRFHIAVNNTAQWSGNLLAGGVTALTMDLRQTMGPDPLAMRLMVWGDGGIWASKNTTPINGSWASYTFGLSGEDLVFVTHDTGGPLGPGGSGVLADTLANVHRIQLRHDAANPTPPGEHPPHVAATIGIDNVAAIPEPGTMAYMLCAGTGLFLYRSARRKKGITPRRP